MVKSKFELSYFINPQDKFHIARVNITSRYDLSCHTHDYAELVWVEKGSGTHLINGMKMNIEEGDLIMIRPSDFHTFIPSNNGITIINVAFYVETLDFFYSRYFSSCESYFWSKTPQPYQIKISKEILKRFSSRAEECMRHNRSNIHLDSLLLFVFRKLTDNINTDNSVSEMPLWLQQAIKQYNNPFIFQQGNNAFVELCDRNINYINRTIKLHLNKTLTELLNELKMQYATNQLSLTDMPIKEICNNCGFNNIGHFYKIFKSIYNQTPLDYRKINQTIV